MIERSSIRIMQHSEDLTEPPRNRNVIPINAARCFGHVKSTVIRLRTVFSANTLISDWKTRLHLTSASAVIRRCRWNDMSLKQFVYITGKRSWRKE